MDCQLCGERFSRDDVKLLNYFPDTSVCWNCYQQMKEKPTTESCFGKINRKEVVHGVLKTVSVGYDQKALECNPERGICRDRKYCRLWGKGRIYKLKEALKG